ncbi:hypothetical protein FBU30_003507 [Linnemannia zychae]|nr:hypothetical protein FBU30_003507 [Linnemannia zychae]
MTTTYSRPRNSRLSRILSLLIALAIVFTVVAAYPSYPQHFQAREDDEDSSSIIEDPGEAADISVPDSTGAGTNLSLIKSAAAKTTPPIPTIKSNTQSATAATISPSSPSTSSTSPTNLMGVDSTNNTLTGTDPRKPPSRITIIKPKPNQINPPLFAIGYPIEFEWQFDKSTLSSSPTNLTLQVTLSSDPTKVWPIANISGTATSYTWNTDNIKTPSNLLMGMYTLNIFDTKVGKQSVAGGVGQIIPNSDLRFGLYIPESKIPGASSMF